MRGNIQYGATIEAELLVVFEFGTATYVCYFHCALGGLIRPTRWRVGRQEGSAAATSAAEGRPSCSERLVGRVRRRRVGRQQRPVRRQQLRVAVGLSLAASCSPSPT